MDPTMLERLGVVEIAGADAFGGEAIPPLAASLILSTYTIVLGAVVANWAEFKAGLSAGYRDMTQ